MKKFFKTTESKINMATEDKLVNTKSFNSLLQENLILPILVGENYEDTGKVSS